MAAARREDIARLIADLEANAPLYSVFRAVYLAESFPVPTIPSATTLAVTGNIGR
jgi:hypothetical protein